MEHKWPAFTTIVQPPDALERTEPIWSDEVLAWRVTAMEEIKDLMGRRAFYHAAGWHKKELDDLWAKEHDDTVSLGSNWGYYIGMDAVSSYYTAGDCKKTGTAALRSYNTPYLVIAYDGKTARGLWYSIGYDADMKSDGGSEIQWRYEKLGVDFILEDGSWKIWHVVTGLDVLEQRGTVTKKLDDRDWLKPAREEFGAPTLAVTTHDPYYNWADNYPAAPEPYETYDDSKSYGPMGNHYARQLLKKEAAK